MFRTTNQIGFIIWNQHEIKIKSTWTQYVYTKTVETWKPVITHIEAPSPISLASQWLSAVDLTNIVAASQQSTDVDPSTVGARKVPAKTDPLLVAVEAIKAEEAQEQNRQKKVAVAIAGLAVAVAVESKMQPVRTKWRLNGIVWGPEAVLVHYAADSCRKMLSLFLNLTDDGWFHCLVRVLLQNQVNQDIRLCVHCGIGFVRPWGIQ